MKTIVHMFNGRLKDEPILSPEQVQAAHAKRMEQREQERAQRMVASTNEGARSLALYLQSLAEPGRDRS